LGNSEILQLSIKDTTARTVGSRQLSYTDILDQNIKDASATPLERSPLKNAKGLSDIPPTPADLRI